VRAAEERLRERERELDEAQQLLRVGFDGAAIGMALMALNGRWLKVNRALCELTGYSEAELLAGSFHDITHAEDLDTDMEQVAQLLSGTISAYAVDKRYLTRAGKQKWVQLTVSLARDGAGDPQYFVAQLQDVDARKRYESQLEQLASRDPLTGLLNHRIFHEQLQGEVARARRHHRPMSVALLDLDHFKHVNDRYGHPAGDQVLRQVAARLTGLIREGEYLARVGGEEFAMILPETSAGGAYVAAERARRIVAATPFENVGHLTLSAGVCELGDGGDAKQVYAQADRALYWAKAQGRNRTCRLTERQPAVA
jgi:diguanylate cyclase (GGDEF)-like protein/PAS domain S-box-containing protein